MRKLLLLVCLFVATPLLAQWEPSDAPKTPPNDGGAPRVYYAHSYDRSVPYRVGLDDPIGVHVQNMDALLKQVNDNCSALVLYINGLPIKGLKPESCDKLSGSVRYRLLRTPESDNIWHGLLGSPRGYTRPVSISVGASDQFSLSSSVTNFQLEIIPRLQFFIFLGVLLIGLIIFIYLCDKQGLIRTGPPSTPIYKRPFSLSLFQMAFWFFLVAASYVFIWLINDELDSITDSVLALLGIGAGTALGASLIDTNKTPTPGVSTDTEASATPTSATPEVTQGFIKDILSDGAALSLHRFQLFVWTLILGVIFIGSVYKGLEMPEFSATLLGLMGISAGTYLGFKVPEGKSDTPSAPTTNAASDAGN
jgi:hypothetical protein